MLSNAAPAEEQSPAGASLDFDKKNGTLYVEWSGPIVAGMADDLRAARGKYVTASDRLPRQSDIFVPAPTRATMASERGHWANCRDP
jgi:hypothetical protein